MRDEAHFVQHSVANYEDQYVVVGTVVPGKVSGHSDILVLMADGSGNILWSNYVDYGFDEFAGAVIVDSQGDIVLTGYTGINGSGDKNLIVVKLDGDGNYVSDAVIEDAGFLNYGLYGMDIAESEGGYIVVGTGVQFPTQSANKYAFVLRLDPDGVIWGRIYRSDFVPKNFDSFNHILKSGPGFLLTGSGRENLTSKQMAVNDLIDPGTGLSLWNLSNAQGTRETGSQYNLYDDRGVMALYHESSNRFFVLYYGKENIPGLFTLDGNTGNLPVPNNAYVSFFQRTFGDWSNIFSGMQWSDGNQDEIVLSGYHIDPGSPPGDGRAMLVRYGLATGSLWSLYPPAQFDGAAYANIGFDFIAQPVNYLSPNSPYYLNQVYYHPKALVRRASAAHSYVFAVPGQDGSTGVFGLDLLKTGMDGDMGCVETAYGLDESAPLMSFTNFVSQPYNFNLLGPGAQVYNASLSNSFICGEPSPSRAGSSLGNIFGSGGIKVYPNPVSDYLAVSGLSGIDPAEILLYDLRGREILSKTNEANSGDIQLDISALESGVYLLQVSSAEEVLFVERVVKE